MDELFNMLFRFGHVLVGIAWIGLLYYFNFVQTEYFKEAEDDARKDAVAKLAPRALWWFRWAAFLTFLTGLALLHYISVKITLEIILEIEHHTQEEIFSTMDIIQRFMEFQAGMILPLILDILLILLKVDFL